MFFPDFDSFEFEHDAFFWFGLTSGGLTFSQAEVHVNKGQTELLKYWQTIKGERALILKLFGVLLFIILIFTYMRS